MRHNSIRLKKTAFCVGKSVLRVMFITGEYKDPKFMHYVQKKNNLLLTSLPGIPVNSNANYRHYNFQVLLIFSEDF